MANKKQPEVRFEGFEGEWEKKQLGSVVEFFSGLTYSPNSVVNGHGTFVLRSSNVKFGEIVNADNIYVASDVVNSKNVQLGDIIVVVRNGSRKLIGKHAQIKKEMDNTVIGAFMTGIRSHESNFINALLSTQQFEIEISKNLGATINQITTGSFKNMIFSISKNAKEQQKIGTFFKQLDDKIALCQRQLELLKEQKKGFLQKMFPKSGEKTPEVRFAGFTEEWEEKKLGELTQIKTGSSDLQDATPNGNYPFFVRSENVERSNRFIYEGEAILIPGEGRLGEIYHYIDGKFDYHQRVYKISDFINNDTSGKFILYELQKNFKRHAMKFTVKATVDSLRMPMLTDYMIKIPCYNEQQKIGTFFKQLDDIIALNQKELDILKEMKKGFLQKMFV